MESTFLYFAYGSNLLKKRIHINNPTARFVDIGRLENHHLDFMKYSDHWRGTSATIVPTDGAHLWGAIWELHKDDLPALDRQEGVETNWYFPKEVTVVTPDGTSLQCRTYQQTVNPPPRAEKTDLPHERRPSITYLDCIIKGAIECNLPDYYVQTLGKIPHNGMEASAKMVENLEEHIYARHKVKSSDVDEEDTFLYFAYGSNMLARRIHMYNPSAVFHTIGRLDNYRIDFIKYSKFWNGPTITTVPTANAHIWGAVWIMHKDDMISLDNEKGVDIKKYYPKIVTISTPHLGELQCRVYEQRINSLPRGDNDVIPLNQLPSKTYKEVIVQGAIECNLPTYYVRMLEKMKHNNEEGCFRMDELLLRYVSCPPCKCTWPGRIPRKPMKLDLKEIK